MTPQDIYKKAYAAQKRLPELEPMIVCDIYWSYLYARDVIKGRWSEAEPNIMQDSCYAYCYAKNVVGGRWLEAETFIMQDAVWSYCYAKDVIKGRWLEAESIIIQDELYAYFYTRDVIKERWLEAEEIISKSDYKIDYIERFFDEPVITKDKVDIIEWERKKQFGYFAQDSLFEQKISVLDIMVMEE